jgi:hypothetical protein
MMQPAAYPDGARRDVRAGRYAVVLYDESGRDMACDRSDGLTVRPVAALSYWILR